MQYVIEGRAEHVLRRTIKLQGYPPTRPRWLTGIWRMVEVGEELRQDTGQVVAWIVDEIRSPRDERGEITRGAEGVPGSRLETRSYGARETGEWNLDLQDLPYGSESYLQTSWSWAGTSAGRTPRDQLEL